MLDRQTEHLRVEAGEDVAEVAGRNDELDLVAHVDDLVLQQLRVSGEVVDDLRYETAHVDGVRGGEHDVRVGGELRGELLVAEDALDGGLRVVEVALDRAHVHVRAGLRAHLQLLNLAHLALRVEDGDRGAGRVCESGQRGLAGVAGGGGQDHDLLVGVAVRRRRVRHETGEDLQRNVLERGGRAVEQFEDVVVAERLQGRDAPVGPLLAVSVGDALRELGLGEVRQQRTEHLGGDLLIRLARQGSDVHLRLAQGIGHEQAAVVGDALADGLLGGK